MGVMLHAVVVGVSVTLGLGLHKVRVVSPRICELACAYTYIYIYIYDLHLYLYTTVTSPS